jgi:hypothetical protein
VISGNTATGAGSGLGYGGGVFNNSGTLALTNCTVSGNSALSGPGGGISNRGTRTHNGAFIPVVPLTGGGGILNLGTLTLTNSTVSGNSAASSAPPHLAYSYGGGILNLGTLTLTNSTVSGNSVSGYSGFGGGIFNYAGTTTLTNSNVSGNSAGLCGGIGNLYGMLMLTSSTVSDNVTGRPYNAYTFYDYGGGILNVGTLTLTDSTVSGNSISGPKGIGAGILNFGPMTLTNSTVSGNSVSGSYGYGGGIWNAYGMTLTNCTVSGNDSSFRGGGIFNYGGPITLTNCTVSGNSAVSGGGIYNPRSTQLDNTLIARNTSTGSAPDVRGSVNATSGFNLIGDGTGMTGISNGLNGNQVGTSANPIDPLLAPLGNYGGPTQTLALLPGSPALDASSNALRGGATTDQRGYARIVNRTVDIGAFESRGFTVTVASGNHQSTVVNTAFAARLRVTVSSPRGEPVAGGVVKFTAPSSGASAVLAPTMATLDASGHAGVKATANAVAGSYTVAASPGGANAPAHFSLTNTPGAASIDPRAFLPGNHKFVPAEKGVDTFTVSLNTTGSESITVNDTVSHTIRGKKAFTVREGTAIDSLAPNTFGAMGLAPSSLDAYFADDQRELRGVFIGGRSQASSNSRGASCRASSERTNESATSSWLPLLSNSR